MWRMNNLAALLLLGIITTVLASESGSDSAAPFRYNLQAEHHLLAGRISRDAEEGTRVMADVEEEGAEEGEEEPVYLKIQWSENVAPKQAPQSTHGVVFMPTAPSETHGGTNSGSHQHTGAAEDQYTQTTSGHLFHNSVNPTPSAFAPNTHSLSSNTQLYPVSGMGNQFNTGSNDFTGTNPFSTSNDFSGSNSLADFIGNSFSGGNSFPASGTFSGPNSFSGSSGFTGSSNFPASGSVNDLLSPDHPHNIHLIHHLRHISKSLVDHNVHKRSDMRSLRRKRRTPDNFMYEGTQTAEHASEQTLERKATQTIQREKTHTTMKKATQTSEKDTTQTTFREATHATHINPLSSVFSDVMLSVHKRDITDSDSTQHDNYKMRSITSTHNRTRMRRSSLQRLVDNLLQRYERDNPAIQRFNDPENRKKRAAEPQTTRPRFVIQETNAFTIDDDDYIVVNDSYELLDHSIIEFYLYITDEHGNILSNPLPFIVYVDTPGDDGSYPTIPAVFAGVLVLCVVFLALFIPLVTRAKRRYKQGKPMFKLGSHPSSADLVEDNGLPRNKSEPNWYGNNSFYTYEEEVEKERNDFTKGLRQYSTKSEPGRKKEPLSEKSSSSGVDVSSQNGADGSPDDFVQRF